MSLEDSLDHIPTRKTHTPYFELLTKHLSEVQTVTPLPSLSLEAKTTLGLVVATTRELDDNFTQTLYAQDLKEQAKKRRLEIIDRWLELAVTQYPLTEALSQIHDSRVTLAAQAIDNRSLMPHVHNLLTMEAVASRQELLRLIGRENRNTRNALITLSSASILMFGGLGGLLSGIIPPGNFATITYLGTTVGAVSFMIAGLVYTGSPADSFRLSQLKQEQHKLQEHLHSAVYPEI